MSCELFIGNLNPSVRIRDLENCFGKYGKIVRCDLKKNYGFIQLGEKRDAEEALRKENNRRLLGSVMTVEWAKGSIGDSGKSGFGKRSGGPPPFRKDRSPGRFDNNRQTRRDRSPIGRGPSQRNGSSPGNDKFFGRSRLDRSSDRAAPRDRFQSSNRYDDRGPSNSRNRGPPPRQNGQTDRSGRSRRSSGSFDDRRNGGPRRF